MLCNIWCATVNNISYDTRGIHLGPQFSQMIHQLKGQARFSGFGNRRNALVQSAIGPLVPPNRGARAQRPPGVRFEPFRFEPSRFEPLRPRSPNRPDDPGPAEAARAQPAFDQTG